MNHVILDGNLTADAILRIAKNGNKCAFFKLAVNERERTDYIPISIFGKDTEPFAKLLKKLTKGSKILLEGRLRSRDITNGDKKETTITVEIKEIEFLNVKTAVSGEADLSSSQNNSNSGGGGKMPSYSPQGNNQEENEENPFGGTPVDDDIPF